MAFLKRCWEHILHDIVAPTRPSSHQLVRLATPFGRSASVRRQAALVITARVQFLSLIFAILVPACAIIDLVLFDWKTGLLLTALRLVAGAGFAVLAWPGERGQAQGYAWSIVRLLSMLLIPTVFYLAALHITGGLDLSHTQSLVVQLYGLMPTIVLAGLAIFPLSALEIFLYSIPVLGIASWGLMDAGGGLSLVQHGPVYWFMFMMIGVAMISGMSQSHYMESLVHHASTDPLTGAQTRRAGIEAIERSMRQARTHDRPLSIMFLDIDHFKQINDSFGHDAGDQALIAFAKGLRQSLRQDDVLIRWGGEEFVAALPGMSMKALPALLEKIRVNGLGLRIDGKPLETSIGIAERGVDQCADWVELVRLADERMYQAKSLGRARAVLPSGQVVAMGSV
ncbi:GGDEF domain-containing protein [Alcaligenaceae bacterium]|nr:GGDEF domain-containing protein [Alcaligenaceae bacterium]